MADGHEGDTARGAQERGREEGGREAVAHEVHEGLDVVDFEGDAALESGGRERAVDGDARAEGRRPVGEGLIDRRAELDVRASGQPVAIVDGEGHDLMA